MSRAPSKTIAALFLLALLGALVVVGIAVASLGWVALAVYVGLVAVGLAVLLRTARSLAAQAKSNSHGRTCTCCTSTVFDPVEVR